MADFVGSPPWQWSPADADDFFAHLRGVRNLSHATIRTYQSDVRLFLEYAKNSSPEPELQQFFDLADLEPERILNSGRKGALAAWRDAVAYKTLYR